MNTQLMLIRLVGEFEVIAGGQDCTPRGAKARAVLALLCQAPDRGCIRRWIEGQLWSDRGAAQASGSLRQALAEIRRAFGDMADHLRTDRDTVSLDRVTTDLDNDPEAVTLALTSGREFLEGIDIADPAFNLWLAEERALLRRMPARRVVGAPVVMAEPARRLPVVLRVAASIDDALQIPALQLADAVGQLLAEFAHIDVFGAGGMPLPSDLPDGGLELVADGKMRSSGAELSLVLRGGAAGQQIWGGQAGPLSGGDMGPLVFQAAQTALAALARLPGGDSGPNRVNALIARALPEMFSYSPTRLRAADRMLAEAQSIAPSARIYAWRSLTHLIMAIEQPDADHAHLGAEAADFARRALELSRANPQVLAMAAIVLAMTEGDASAAEWARDAVARSPNNAFCHSALACVLMRAGDHAAALLAARDGARIVEGSEFAHWWEAGCGLVALCGGQLADATRHYGTAEAQSPGFGSALRPLLFLTLANGAEDAAAGMLSRLRAVDPAFTPDRLAGDARYPSQILRDSGLLSRHGAAVDRLLLQMEDR